MEEVVVFARTRRVFYKGMESGLEQVVNEERQGQTSSECRGHGGSCTIEATHHRATVFLNNTRTKKHLRLGRHPRQHFSGLQTRQTAHQPTKQSTAALELASVLAAWQGALSIHRLATPEGEWIKMDKFQWSCALI